MTDQWLIKAVLIVVACVFAVLVMRRTTTARNQALRTISLLMFLGTVIVGVLIPSIINAVALAVGIGRGTDLLFYGFMVVFTGTLLSNSRNNSARDRKITDLARTIALANPFPPSTERGASLT